MISVEQFRQLLRSDARDWEDVTEGQQIDVDGLEYLKIKVTDTNKYWDTDSYGDEIADAYVVFEVTDADETAFFKLEGTYDSYSDWDWSYYGVSQVVGTPKTVTVWNRS